MVNIRLYDNGEIIKYGEHRLYDNGKITKYGEHRLYDNGEITSWHVPTMINVWATYGKSRLYGYGDTDLITKG
jgi:hypothetical protein